MTARVHDRIRAVLWHQNRVRLLDQRRLPDTIDYLDLARCDEVAQAITDMVVRGAPAIGIAAAYGVVLAARTCAASDWRRAIEPDMERLAAARPTAVNLHWAIARMRAVIDRLNRDAARADSTMPDPAMSDLGHELLAEARRIHEEDIAANYRMGELGAALLDGNSVLTHCNTGSLATGGYGTALGVIRNGFHAGRIAKVYADETRPWLQGARLTAWELVQDGIPVTLLCDAAAASLLRQGDVGWVIVGADRVAANGDVANKIGTYNLAINARHHGVKFMVVAPTSTIDLATASGDDIDIEYRDAGEMLSSRALSEHGVAVWNPVFDITPAELIDALVTERGVLHRPDRAKLAALLRLRQKNGAITAPL
ncbi:MAG: S-methyl-5-thioribose-1-phosphate isomerase [Gammaproteobacteria bacterium]|nr:S-methyl-5-thioribose-1-phosphate isomerase [Gammaproteobacteria bacterium]